MHGEDGAVVGGVRLAPGFEFGNAHPRLLGTRFLWGDGCHGGYEQEDHHTDRTDSLGVTGGSMSGAGVIGTSRDGAGVEASSTYGHALETKGGGVRFHGISGVATIKSGAKKVTIRTRSPDTLIEAKTFVLISPETNVGSRSLWFSKVLEKQEVTIHISQSRSSETKVAYLTLDHG